VPDAVLYEATIKSDALGAQSIAEWVQRHDSDPSSLLRVFIEEVARPLVPYTPSSAAFVHAFSIVLPQFLIPQMLVAFSTSWP
jgi:hypothetical protein